MMEVTVDVIVEFATTLFVLSTMLSMGLELTTNQLLEALRKQRLLVKSLLVNLLVVPFFAYVMVRLLPLSSGYTAGILLIAMAPGAPFGPKLAEISKSDIAFASGLMAVLGILSVATIPITMVLLIPDAATADPLAIAQMVVVVQLVPLIVGLGIKTWHLSLSARLRPPVQRLSDLSFIILLVLMLSVYSDEMVSLFGTGTLFVTIVVVGAALLSGYLLGGPAQNTREVLATTTAARNGAIALFIATTSFSDPNVLIIVLAFSFIGVVGSGLIASVWRRRITSG